MTYNNPKEAFDIAIETGRLVVDENSIYYAGKYMYMGDDERGKAMFKNIVTRQYLEVV